MYKFISLFVVMSSFASFSNMQISLSSQGEEMIGEFIEGPNRLSGQVITGECRGTYDFKIMRHELSMNFPRCRELNVTIDIKLRDLESVVDDFMPMNITFKAARFHNVPRNGLIKRLR